MATTSTSGLVRNTDFSAELLLNKVMNKQYKSQNGNTLTLAGRMNASKLDSEAQRYGIEAENLAKAVTFSEGAQDVMTELLDLAKKVQGAVNSTTDTSALKSLGNTFDAELTALKEAKIGDVSSSVLNGGTSVANLGLGAGTIALGQTDITAAYSALTAALDKMKTGSTSDPSSLDTTINQLNAAVAAEGAKANLVRNRYDALNDLASSYLEASNNQVVTEGGSATSLLNSLL